MEKMKVLAFCADAEDKDSYEKYGEGLLEVDTEPRALTAENAELVKGYEAVIILTRCFITGELARKLAEYGVRYVLTRSAGYDHMDIKAIRQAGLRAANVALYSPNAISEHVCMTALMMIRNMKRQLRMISDGDYSLKGIKGRELRKMTVGIVGAGRIGFETIKIFRSFTPDLLVYDMIERNDVKEYASYVSLEELYERSDMIIYHCPLTEENYHMVNEKTIAGMKEGVILINPARGGLWDYKAVYENLKTGRIGSVAFDVYETEKNYLRRQVPPEELKDEVLTGLIRHERAIYTAHSAFFTDAAIENMFEVTAKNLLEYRKKGSCGNELTDR